jgi:hypothetical protein
MLKLRTMWQVTASATRRRDRSLASGRAGDVEYGILVALIAVAALGAIQTLGGGIAAFFGRLLLGHFQGLG